MKRSAPIVIVLFLLLAGSAAFVLGSTTPCPDCPAGAHARDSVGRTHDFASVDCPRCDDGGRITRFRRWFRWNLDTDLVQSLLLAAWLGERQPGEDGALLRRLLARSGVDLPAGVVKFRNGFFIDDAEEALIVLTYTRRGAGPTEHSGGLVLFAPSGAVLDELCWTTPTDPESWESLWLRSGTRRADCWVWSDGTKGGALRLLHGQKMETFPPSGFQVNVRGGRLAVVPAPGPKPDVAPSDSRSP